MARKERSLAGFGDVASTNINGDNNASENNNINASVNKHENNDNNVNINVNKNNNIHDNNDFLDTILGGNKKKDEAVLTGIYLQKDVAQLLDKLGKKGGKGTKSRIVNEALRRAFTEKGLM